MAQPITQTEYLRAYSTAAPPSAPFQVPFNNFFSNPLSNEFHPSLTNRNANWLFSELQGTPQVFSCNYVCNNSSIASVVTGPASLCNGTANFTLQNATPNTPISWFSSVPTGLSINSSGVATRLNNYNGQATITVAINGNCGSATLPPLSIWVGNPPADNNTLIWTGRRGVNPVTIGAGSMNQYQCDFVPFADSYTWILPYGFVAVGSTNTLSPFITLSSPNQAGTYTLFCRVNNGSCFSYTRSLTITVSDGGGGGIQMRTAYPNPTNDFFTVKLKEQDGKEVAEVTLFNKNMEQVYFIRTEEKEITISTANLLPGTYFLRIILGKEVIQKQVIVNR